MTPAALAEHATRAMAESLRLLHDVLADGPLAGRYWLFGGLLLGWAREGAILPHDTQDADFAYLAEDEDRLEAAFPDLLAAGFSPLYRWPSATSAEATEYCFEREGARFEFFRLQVAGGRFRWRTYGGTPEGPVANDCEAPAQPLEEIPFLGRSWLKSRDHDLELTALYGDWRTPRPDWGYMEAPSIVGTQPFDWSHESIRWSPC